MCYIKDVTPQDKNQIAYDEFSEGHIFNLHWPTRVIKSLSGGDLIILKQHSKITHVVKVIDPTGFEDQGKTEYSVYNVVYCVKRYEQLKVRDVLGDSNNDQGSGRKITIKRTELLQKLKIKWEDYVQSLEYSGFSEAEFSEGLKKYKTHITIERNQTLVKKKKENFKRNNDGDLYCEICKFNFKKKYGQVGEDFIEAHHLEPLGGRTKGSKTSEDDLILVCSNCHRMIHRLKPLKTKVEEIQKALKQN